MLGNNLVNLILEPGLDAWVLCQQMRGK